MHPVSKVRVRVVEEPSRLVGDHRNPEKKYIYICMYVYIIKEERVVETKSESMGAGAGCPVSVYAPGSTRFLVVPMVTPVLTWLPLLSSCLPSGPL